MTNETVTRVIEWVAPGYEGSFTQYTVTPDGKLYITQIATRDNLARALTDPRPTILTYGSFDIALDAAKQLIANRTEDGDAVELAEDGKPLHA